MNWPNPDQKEIKRTYVFVNSSDKKNSKMLVLEQLGSVKSKHASKELVSPLVIVNPE